MDMPRVGTTVNWRTPLSTVMSSTPSRRPPCKVVFDTLHLGGPSPPPPPPPPPLALQDSVRRFAATLVSVCWTPRKGGAGDDDDDEDSYSARASSGLSKVVPASELAVPARAAPKILGILGRSIGPSLSNAATKSERS